MPPPLTFQVLGAGLWAGGNSNVSSLSSLSDSEIQGAVPAGDSIERRTRRRATQLSRAAADSFAQAIAQSGLDAALVPTVFCSALGETPAMVEQVDLVCRGVELSPMKFAVSVHSSSSTAVTISAKNRKLTSSISANFDTVAAGLFEMGAILGAEGGAGVVVFLEDNSPDRFLAPDERYGRMSVSLAVRLLTAKESERATISLPSNESPLSDALRQANLPDLLARSPVSGALDLLAALQEKEPSVVRLDRGQGSGYWVRVTPAGSASSPSRDGGT